MSLCRSIAICLSLTVVAQGSSAFAQSSAETRRAPASFKLPQAHPRILLSDEATVARLKKVLDSRPAAAGPFQDQVAG